MQNLRKTSETGRSMVEMLGVLAIIGVLSVGGVYGYGVAMKKHKANELLHRASMLASTVSAQIMSGKNQTTLDSFANSNLGTFTLETYTDGDNTFKLKISDIDGNVCEQMKSSMGGMVRDIVCDENAKTALMTFNKDLSTTDLPKTESVIDKNITNPEDCQKAGKTWCVEASSGNGQCSNSTDCCRGVLAPTCQDCTSGEGTYSFTNGIPYTECDSDGDGSNDGQCLPDESGNPPFTCQQVSCQETESCCVMYDMEMLGQVVNDPSALEALGISLSTLAKQVHQAQCSSCDPSDGKTTPLADGTSCNYVFINGDNELEGMLGSCQNGKCEKDLCKTNDDCAQGKFCFCGKTGLASWENWVLDYECEGSCVPVGQTTELTINIDDEEYLEYNGKKLWLPAKGSTAYSLNYNWYSANNWCKAQNKKLFDPHMQCCRGTNCTPENPPYIQAIDINGVCYRYNGEIDPLVETISALFGYGTSESKVFGELVWLGGVVHLSTIGLYMPIWLDGEFSDGSFDTLDGTPLCE